MATRNGRGSMIRVRIETSFINHRRSGEPLNRLGEPGESAHWDYGSTKFVPAPPFKRRDSRIAVRTHASDRRNQCHANHAVTAVWHTKSGSGR